MPPYRPVSEPVNYPIIRQSVVVGSVLLLIFSGVWLLPDTQEETSHKTTASEQLVIQELPAATVIEPLHIPSDALEATAAHVYDVRSGTTIYQREASRVHSIASITKLMTALLVHELLAELDEPIIVSAAAVAQHGNSGLRVGERITAENLNSYALLASSNDAAYALAYSLGERIMPGKGSEAFINLMNIRAQELGLEDTQFQNPTGLDVSAAESGALSTATDVSTLMSYIVTNYPELLQPTRAVETRILNQEGGFHLAANTNPIVDTIPNLLGSKTGFTNLAGGNLTIAYDAGFNRPIIITVLDSSWSGRFTDVQKLVEAVQRHLQEDLEYSE